MTTMLSRFATAFEEVAETWPEAEPRLTERWCTGINLYASMAATALRHVREQPWPEPLQSSRGIVHGVQVIGRYIGYGVEAASRQRLTKQQFSEGMQRDESLWPLVRIAQNPQRANHGIENAVGLFPASFQHTYQDLYAWHDGTLALKDLDEIILRERSRSGVDAYDSRQCPMQKARQLKPIYEALLTISLKDKQLVDVSLRKGFWSSLAGNK